MANTLSGRNSDLTTSPPRIAPTPRPPKEDMNWRRENVPRSSNPDDPGVSVVFLTVIVMILSRFASSRPLGGTLGNGRGRVPDLDRVCLFGLLELG